MRTGIPVDHRVTTGSPPPTAPRWVRRLSLLALLVVLLLLGDVGGRQIRKQAPDFEYFYKGGKALLEHGARDPGYDVVDGRVELRGTLDWYWLAVPRIMTLFASLGHPAGGYTWLLLNLIGLVLILRLLGRHLSGLPPQDWPVTQLVPLLLLAAYWRWEFRLNQIDTLTLLLMVCSYVTWEMGRRGIAGFWLGLAVILKLTPALLVAWFALKRQYRTVSVAILTIILAGPVADTLALGPELTREAYVAWARNALDRGSHRALVDEQREMDWRNQSLGAIASRWLHPTNINTHFDNDPRHQRQYGDRTTRTMNLVTLPRATVGWIATGAVGALGLALLWIARRPAWELTRWQLRLEWALVILVMLATMPVMRRYHMIWTLPAISLLAAAVHYAGGRGSWPRVALAVLAAVLVTQACMLVRTLEAAGLVWLSVILLMVPIAWMLGRLQRHPTSLPSPHYAPPSFTPEVLGDA